ncbi:MULTISPECIES: hypothetical protein [Streptomyces]|uniref:hypothetical protein n=1 Tax=Streptomyces TaxID=1883 RepID=UPI002E115FB7|nr:MULTISPECIES: hypothetical protein [Streptomyces griseus group]WSI46069.1 hypothetical protein OG366_00370 [Streptomyces cyaneofuscatus]WSI52678.1 hypothetical protein OG366_36795 [Streptomyces cyaneofuscatus]
MNAEPGTPSEFEALADALRVVLREDREGRREIDLLADASFRLWLSNAAERIAAAAMIPLARLHALLGDFLSIATHAVSTARQTYRDEKRRYRRFPRS